jgi:thioredoxin-related protein
VLPEEFAMRLRILALLLVLAPATTATAAEDAWFVEYDKAQAEAERLGKELLIDFGGSDWCLPCQRLKARILDRPEFVRLAAEQFVLLDVDDLQRTKMPEGRKERYEKLQQRYGVEAFPTVVLATPQGLAYAQTTYLEAVQDPAAYWKHLQPLRNRGKQFRAGLARAATLDGRARADALADALSRIHPDFVVKFHADRVKELEGLTPADATSYLAFLDGRKAVTAIQERVKDKDLGATSVEAVNAVIEAKKLRGEALQDALVLRALCQLRADRPRDALATLGAVLDAQATRSAFDRGDFVPLDEKAIHAVRQRLEAGRKDEKDRVAQYYALHRVFEFELPDRFETCCGHGYRPKFLARGVVGEKYGKALLDSTADLPAEARAKALGQGLEGTLLSRQGPIKEIIDEVIPRLVGKAETATYLPEPYKTWVAR